MRQQPELNPMVWVGSSRKDLRKLPDGAQDKIGTALQQVQYTISSERLREKTSCSEIRSGCHIINLCL